MPTRRTPKELPDFDPAAVDALLAGRTTMEEMDDLFRQMKRVLMERVLSGELTHHLGYGRGEEKPDGQPNHRNGTSPKTVLTEDGAIPLAISRDREGTFTAQLVPKNARRLPKFDQHMLSLYAHGMTIAEIRAHLEEMYQVEVAPACISAVTDEVLEEVTAWHQRPLESCYPVVIFDALRIKIRDEGTVRNKAVYLALGIKRDGAKDVLGLWIEQTEGAKFWHRVMTDLRARGVDDILIAPIDGLTGFPDAIEAVFPQTQIHTCVVPLVRRSLPPSRSKTAGVWRACSERSIGPRPWPPRRPRCQRLPRVPRATAIRPSRRSGAGSGNTSRRPSRIRPRFDASSPPRMRSRVYTASCARSSRPAVTSQPTKPRPSSCISHYATSKNAGIQRHRFVRHPGYLGSLLCLNGIAPASGNTFTLLASIAATFAAYAYRIRVEDAMLVAAFGAPYERYRRETGAILPFFRVHGESV